MFNDPLFLTVGTLTDFGSMLNNFPHKNPTFILANTLYFLTSAKTFEFFNFSALFESNTTEAFANIPLSFTFIEDFTNYCSDVASSRPRKTFGISEFENMEPSFQYLETEIRRRHIKFPHLTREEIWEVMNSLGSDSLEMSLKMFDDMDNTPTDYSNLYNYNGTLLNVSELAPHEIFKLAREVDDIDKFESLEHIRSVYIGTAPNVKLYYPEPFIASPSFIHNDLGFLHILQYQFWLWFVFIFLIVFYLISFLCVVRWCAHRNQPRRETRGVSRSKCGDLITATVPVTWALSIIVSESTDATDYYDGFGTGELIVGVRAYQWGWEYYYPKSVDLNYNVNPSYSTFIGNSLKYNTTTSRNLDSNNVWKFYQNKIDDAIITPAHLLVIPLDNSKIINFMNFKEIGTTPLKNSDAFNKIRTHSKVFTTNLVHTPSVFTDKYIKLNALFTNENDLNNSLTYGLKRQHNLTSTAASTNINSTFLDSTSMDKFLNYNLQYNQNSKKTNLFNQDLNLLIKKNNLDNSSSMFNVLKTLFEDSNVYSSDTLKLLVSYPNLIKEIGDNSDKKIMQYPLRKLLNSKLYRNTLNNKDFLLNSFNNNLTTSTTFNFVDSHLDNVSKTSKNFTLNSFNNSLLPTEQSVRMYDKLLPNSSNYNLSLGFNSLDSNLNRLNLNSAFTNPLFYHSLSKSNWSDITLFNKLSSNRLSFDLTTTPLMTNNPHLIHKEFDSSTYISHNTSYKGTDVIDKITSEKGELIHLLTGRRESAPKGIQAAYWQMFWANTNPDLRINNALKSSLNQDFFIYHLLLITPNMIFVMLKLLKCLKIYFGNLHTRVITI